MTKLCPLCFERYPEEQDVCDNDGMPLCGQGDPSSQTLINGRYRVLSKIGSGGMGTVYEVENVITGERAAMKMLGRKWARIPTYRARFLRESEITQQLLHENIVEVFEVDETPDGLMYIVMELMSGENLADTLRRGPLPLARALEIGVQITRGLARAHDAGVIHRDVKPANVMFASEQDEFDHVKLLDFGLAWSKGAVKLTDTGEIFGTPEYISPEQLAGVKATIHSDLYSLGILLYEIATGCVPFEGDITSLFMCHLEREPMVPSSIPGASYLPPSFDQIVLKLLSKNPQERYADAHHLLKDLDSVIQDISRTTLRPRPNTISMVDTLENRWNGIENMIQAYPVAERPGWFEPCLQKLGALVGEAKLLSRPNNQSSDSPAVDQGIKSQRDRLVRALEVITDDESKLIRIIEIEKKRLRAVEQGIASAQMSRQIPPRELTEAQDRLHRELRDKRAELVDIRFQLGQLRHRIQNLEKELENSVEDVRETDIFPGRELGQVLAEFETTANRIELFLKLVRDSLAII